MYFFRESYLPNNFNVLTTNAPFGELKRVHGATLFQNNWYIPNEFPFLIKSFEDIHKLKCFKKKFLDFEPGLKNKLKNKILSYLEDDIQIPQLGKTPLREHQVKACIKTFQNPRFGLFMDCRTGKTLVMLYTIAYHNLRALVICPRIACENWIKEVNTHFPSDLKAISIYGKDKKSREKLLKEASQQNFDIVITSFENLRIIQDELKKELNFDSLIIDEAHRIKSYNASRTKAIINVSTKAKYRYLLTGTPTVGEPTDLFAQMLILSPSIFFDWSYWYFTQKFLVYSKPRVAQDKFGNKFINDRIYPIGTKNEEILNQIISPYIIRTRRSECKGLPEREDITLEYQLSPQQKKTYKEIISEDKFTLEDKEYFVENAAVKFMKLSMICSGFLYYYEPNTPTDKKGRPLKEYRKVHIFSKNPKLELLKEYIDDYLAEKTNKVIIWSNYDQEQDFVKEIFDEYGILELRGGNENDPFKTIDIFTNSKDYRILSAKQSMGISVDISVASSAFCFSRSPNFDFDRQSRDRIDGYRQKASSLSMYYFSCLGTVDELIHKLISKKESLDKRLTDIHKKCIGCKNLIKCINKQIEYQSPECKYEKVKIN